MRPSPLRTEVKGLDLHVAPDIFADSLTAEVSNYSRLFSYADHAARWYCCATAALSSALVAVSVIKVLPMTPKPGDAAPDDDHVAASLAHHSLRCVVLLPQRVSGTGETHTGRHIQELIHSYVPQPLLGNESCNES